MGRLRNYEHLSNLYLRISAIARVSMKIWCFLNQDTAIKWSELLIVE